MNSYERIKRMYEHKEADRIPIIDDPWAGPALSPIGAFVQIVLSEGAEMSGTVAGAAHKQGAVLSFRHRGPGLIAKRTVFYSRYNAVFHTNSPSSITFFNLPVLNSFAHRLTEKIFIPKQPT